MQRVLDFPRSAHSSKVSPILKVQVVPFDHPDSVNMFTEKPLYVTPAAIKEYTRETIIACLKLLQDQAKIHRGIDHFQVFASPEPSKPDLWFINEDGGAIAVLLPSDY